MTTIKPRALEGSGGGAQPATPTTEPDDLQSTANASVLFLIAEGELEGFPTQDWARWIYFDDVPVERNNGKRNFKGMTFQYRSGTLGQSHIPGFGAIESEDPPIGIKVTQGQPVVRVVDNTAADWVRVRIVLPALQKQDGGGVTGSKLEFKIDVAPAGQPFQTRINGVLKGKASEPVQFDYRIRLRGAAPWQVRIRRITDDSDNQSLQNDLIWQALTTIVDAKLRYPGSALFGCRFDARQFRSIPNIAIEQLGERILVPHNYDPETRTYSGVFNGTLKRAYSTNPAWIYYDLLTDRRGGCGKWIEPGQVDIWSLYAIGQYCDQLVPDGKGGWEPRYSCNIYIQNREEAYRLLGSIASIFRGMAYWSRGAITTSFDAPAAPVRLYTEANVVQEVDENGQITKPPFVYSGSSLKARHTVAFVEWSDPKDGYKSKIEPYIDREALAIYGYRETRVVAVGCTSQGQARRVGKWLIYSEQNETETVTFSIGSEGMLARLGEIIKIADPMRSLSRWGGRILASTPGPVWQLTLDYPVETGHGSYTLSIVQSDGTQTEVPATVIDSTTVAVVGLNEPPIPGSVWILSSNQVQPQLFRVVGAVEEAPHRYEITGVAHNPSKYAFIEADEPLREHDIVSIQDPNRSPDEPDGVSVSEAIAIEAGNAIVNLTVSWNAVAHPLVNRYRVQWRSSDDPEWETIGTTAETSLTIRDVDLTTYEFRVSATTATGVSGLDSELISFTPLANAWITQDGQSPWLAQDNGVIQAQTT